jgi:hypothetical protein
MVLLKEKMKEGSWHFGHPRMNSATIAGIFKILIEELKSQQIKD